MAVKLRLSREGKKKQPFYRIVAADSRVCRDGKYIEKIGHYNPLSRPAEIMIDEEKAFYWLKNGAIPTDTVKSLLSQRGIMLKWHLMRHGYDPSKIEEEFKKWELLQLERQKREEAIAAQAKQEQPPQAIGEEAAPEVNDKVKTEGEEAVEVKANDKPSAPQVETSPPEQPITETMETDKS